MCPVAARWLIGDAAMVCHVIVVETARDGLVLVDTGFGVRDCEDRARVPRLFRALVNPRLDAAQTAVAQLARLGFRADDVRHIVITHLDLDHAGGLRDFPRAAVHLHRPEYLAAMRRDRLADWARYLPRQWAHGPRWVTYLPEGDTWMGLPAVRQLDGIRDEIALVPLVGHTRGHSGVAVNTGHRWLLHAGDAIFHREELTGGRVPGGLRAMATVDEDDRRARIATVATLRELARRPDVTIVNSHDPVLLQSAQATVAIATSPAATWSESG